MSLFQRQNIVLHSGQASDFKIECDDLSFSDIETLCYLISKKFKFSEVFGVPRGGLKFQEGLKKYRTLRSDLDPTLIVDDVLTTGDSMTEYVKEHEIKNPVGVVIFARGKCPLWIKPMFQMWDIPIKPPLVKPMKCRRKFPEELVKDYGEQTYRDHQRTNNPLEDAAWASVYVAEAVGQIIESEMNKFHAALVKYAKTTKFPDNFI